MNDHKELIGDIGDCLIAQPSEAVCKRVLREAADAIEQLVKERDAAVADLTNIVHNMGNTCICDYCIGCVSNGFREGCKTDDGDRWEWRGVREVEHEAD